MPAGFPQPDAVTYVKASTNGPTIIVDGYSTETLEGMYVEYKDRLHEAGYTVGGHACANGHVSVHITNRPSG